MNPHSPRLRLDGATLLAQLRQLGDLGRDPAGGRTRLALSDADKAGRDLLVSWMRDLDLEVRIDQIGNIFGTLRAASDDGGQRPLMIGSHIDTVVRAGAFDGCYGVLAGLAVARAFRAAGASPARSITVAAWTNEEGARYQPDMMGSLVHAGGLPLADALAVTGDDGTRLGAELERIGYAGDLAIGAIVPHEYLELHIEQGPVLDDEGIAIGAVERLQGISWQQIAIEGAANHAGTTPLGRRADAGWAAAAIIMALRELASGSGTTLATVGSLRLEPDVINIIPGSAALTVDLRDPDDGRLADAERWLAAKLADIASQEGVAISAEPLVRLAPVAFSAELVAAIEEAAGALGVSHRRMVSGAGHDAQMIARIAPAAMIFVPSRAGVSHSPAEHTDDAHLLSGAALLLEVVRRRLTEEIQP
ncbi:MAG TPA: Zn-dependent hydrolase [Herpetosiphonaceae bacterium]